MVHGRAPTLGTAIDVGTTLGVALTLPTALSSTFPIDVPLLPVLGGPLPVAFLAGYHGVPVAGGAIRVRRRASPAHGRLPAPVSPAGIRLLADAVASGVPGSTGTVVSEP
ncbi:hypothetical protein N0B31_07575 [Salinirubellus salinus]|uniref:Uncharacterized protein n=1 Tax=Salinirubellus salinus TaxID=1364945 RepID=A0A9E7R5T2_9EURY|nr:hypothetical protein [Salinirubellus salinus]UWM56142.1 hypothetical protein N0B31_07575 [Salinirubellus salinus]